MLFERPRISFAELEARSGWRVQPEGLCQGALCIPLPRALQHDAGFELAELGRLLGAPCVEDVEANLWALGPRAAEHALASAQAPELVLPDVRDQPFTLSSLRGKKVLLLAWASW